ncbi:DUF6642 family protein [Micromonospora siamensis]|uniref:CHAT domain-containing protein n=1 Tax=Micromonospora siamensis TaxID=299152 RepID=A0A1C5IYW7_9ACTN|nr:hypothetical protein [Micromonospora siamensis]SCG63495.1 hypothetical protein GA0074704_3947 [Micromonospora siamensis]
MPKPGGVFCFEGEWEDDLAERGSVLPTLELLERLGSIRFIHRDTATPQELRYFLERWLTRKYAAYQVGFFALHGSPTRLHLSDSHSVGLAEIASWMSGQCEGKRFYFGSCSVLRASDTTLSEFLRETKAAMLCGFTKEIDWIESAAFETVVLNSMVNGGKVDSVERLVKSSRWAPLAQHYGFRIVYQNGRST